MAIEAKLIANRDKIVRFIREAKQKGCRLIVFPESALSSEVGITKAEIDTAIETIRTATDENDIYSIVCVLYKKSDEGRLFNSLMVVDPNGRISLRYHKLYDVRPNQVPPPFLVDGIQCSTIICADRWIRGVEEFGALSGSKILIECSDNFAAEWRPELQWFWHVPRALRNGSYSQSVNTATNHDLDHNELENLKHGHTAVIGPDGRFKLATNESPDRMFITIVDPSEASGMGASRRRKHPIHLTYERSVSPEDALQRKQFWVNLASFRTFTATVNAARSETLQKPSSSAGGGSVIWEDFQFNKERGIGPYAAVPLVEAGVGEELIYAPQRVNKVNPWFQQMAERRNSQMKDWYELGAHIIDAEAPVDIEALVK